MTTSLPFLAYLYNSDPRFAYPGRPPLVATERWLAGVWVIGNNYRGSGFYGSYPPGYVDRVTCMFPEARRRLHLFSGSLPPQDGWVRFDCQGNADVLGDAHRLSDLVSHDFDLILADPPYSQEDAKRYGTGMVNRLRVVRECAKVLRPGGFLIWLDTVLPMYRKDELRLVGTIGVVGSTNRRVRFVFMWQKEAEAKEGEKGC